MVRHLDHASNEPCALCDAEKREKSKRNHPAGKDVWDVVLRKMIREARGETEELEVWL